MTVPIKHVCYSSNLIFISDFIVNLIVVYTSLFYIFQFVFEHPIFCSIYIFRRRVQNLFKHVNVKRNFKQKKKKKLHLRCLRRSWIRLWISTGNRMIVSSINPLSAKPRKWSNTLKQFVGNLPTNFFECVWPFCEFGA